MKPVLLWGAVLLAGCASVPHIERSAVEHDQRATQLEAEGRYQAASKERDAAAKERAKAAYRAQTASEAPVVPTVPRE